MRNQRTSHSPFRTTQSIIRDSPHTQLDESRISNNRGPQNRESMRSRMLINQSHNNIQNQGQQVRKQIANERIQEKGGNPNEFNPKKFVTKDLKAFYIDQFNRNQTLLILNKFSITMIQNKQESYLPMIQNNC
ncbi:unnamed protein product [Paramecium octaurelia]|uniref:Uncharacterized protein n=1 Tax=Paramecium octaurelia TaxID=43137 RepID=A0A8S1XBS9_PAROT|nr:unnamed protein product [Paramecium octaurelia]